MSWMDQIGKMAGSMFGNASESDTAQAASDHVQESDSAELASDLQKSVSTMDPSSLEQFGQHLLHSFTNNQSFDGDAATATNGAGTTQDAVAAGDGGAISNLIAYGRANPDVLKQAASAFMQRNPGAIASMAPGIIQGIMGRIGGGGNAPASQKDDDSN